MKYLNLLLLLACFGLCSASGPKGFSPPPIKLEEHSPRSILAVQRSADSNYFKRDPEMYRLEKKIHSGKVMTIAGITMTGLSPLLLLGAYGCTAAMENSYYSNARDGLALTGTIFFYATGIGCVAAGIPLTVIGSIRWSEGKYEKRLYTGTATLTPTIGPTTAGLKLTF